MKVAEEMLAKYYNNMVNIPTNPVNAETGLYTTKPINSLDDLLKMKFRSVGARAETFKEMGCSGMVGLPGSEIIPSLQKGVIEGAEFASPFVDYDLGYADVAKYWYMSNVPSTGYNWMYINRKTWEKLPDDLKKIVLEANRQTSLWAIGFINTQDILYMEKAAAKGVIVKMWPKEIDDAALAAQERIFKRRMNDPVFKTFYDSWKSFETKYQKYQDIMDASR
jgi:TRAP-type mannitol/chloroaromatic compound transport system substrate-binding protein